MVRMAVGPLEVVLSVSRLKKSGLAVRPPMADSGVPAIGSAPEVWAMIEKAAVAAVVEDPAAREHVLGKRPGRSGGAVLGRRRSGGGGQPLFAASTRKNNTAAKPGRK